MIKYKESWCGGVNILFLLAMLIGAIISIPIGPLGLLCVQRSLRSGFYKGFISGIGAALSDFTYGLIVLFTFDIIDSIFHKEAMVINLILAVIFLLLGLKLLKSKDLELQDEFIHPMLSAYFIGISNVGTVLIFLGIYTYFPIDIGLENFVFSIRILLSIFLGACLFWLITCKLISRWRNNFKLHHFVILDKIIGGIIILFGSINLIKFLFEVTRSRV